MKKKIVKNQVALPHHMHSLLNYLIPKMKSLSKKDKLVKNKMT